MSEPRSIHRTKAIAGMLTAALITSLFVIVPAIVNAAPVDDVVISAGRTGSPFSLVSGPTRALLLDTALFGPLGTMSDIDTLTIKPEVEIINTPYLADVDIFFDAWTYDVGSGDSPAWFQEEIDDLEEWVTAGGVLIINEDAAATDALGGAFGVPITGDNLDGNMAPGLGSPVETALNIEAGAAAHPIVNGPAGIVAGLDAFGTHGHFASVMAPWITIATYPTSGAPAVITRPWGDGHVLATSDSNFFDENFVAPLRNMTFSQNVFAWAISETEILGLSPTPTGGPAPTSTPTATATPLPPPPTATAVPATPTATATAIPTATATPTPTEACNGVTATMVGTEDDDIIMGTSGNDVIVGLGGNDEIHGLGGQDIICGGAGNDLLYGDDEGDTMSGGGGNDMLFGGRNADTISGNNGADTIEAGKGHDIVSGGKKNDVIKGQSGNDTLTGNKGADTLRGGKGTDTCNGGAGIDTKDSCEN